MPKSHPLHLLIINSQQLETNCPHAARKEAFSRNVSLSPESEEDANMGAEPSPESQHSIGIGAEYPPGSQSGSGIDAPPSPESEDDLGNDADLSSESQDSFRMGPLPSPWSKYSIGMGASPSPQSQSSFSMGPPPELQDHNAELALTMQVLTFGIKAQEFGISTPMSENFRMVIPLLSKAQEPFGSSSGALWELKRRSSGWISSMH